jgi:large subunit ribosomal protein L17
MRHRVDHRKLNRTASHRKAMLCNMVTSLFAAERITTTDAKAKEARRLAEKLNTRARKGYTAHQDVANLRDAGKEDEARQMEAIALAHWRQAGRFVRKISVLKKLFEEIAPHYLGREGGYTRIVRMNRRLGDNAQTVLLELVGTEKTDKPVMKKGATDVEADAKESKSSKGAPAAKEKKKAPKKAPKKAKAKDKDDKDKKAKTKTKTKAKSKATSQKGTKPRAK